MIKILSNNTSAAIKTSQYKNSLQEQFGGGIKQCKFLLGTVELQVKWEDTRISAILRSMEEIYVETLTLSFKYRTSKPSSETSIWSESYTGEFLSEGQDRFPGVETCKQRRNGAWAMWVAESPNTEGLFFCQAHPVTHPLSFQCRPSRRRLSVTWTINCLLPKDGETALSDVKIRRGKRVEVVEGWQKRWGTHFKGKRSSTQRRGWMAGPSIASPQGIQESIKHLKFAGIELDWFALGPHYANTTGDWLKPSEGFHDKMGSASRLISEAYLVPGLRFAPFLVSRYSKIAEEQRGWLVNTEKGVPVALKSYLNRKDVTYILDITNPEVKKHIQKLFTIMRDQWGFRVFILDRIADLATSGRRADNTIPPGGLIADAARLVRETVGNKVLLVGMKAPLLAAPGIWDIQAVSDEPKSSSSAKSLIDIASAMIHRAGWNKTVSINAPGPLSVELFQDPNDIAKNTLQRAVLLSAGSVIFAGDPRTMGKGAQHRVKDFQRVFKECLTGRLVLGDQRGGGRKHVLVARNDRGWVALFNFSPNETEICLDRSTLKSELGINSILSAEDRTVFNSLEIHVGLPPWGHRLFKG